MKSNTQVCIKEKHSDGQNQVPFVLSSLATNNVSILHHLVCLSFSRQQERDKNLIKVIVWAEIPDIKPPNSS